MDSSTYSSSAFYGESLNADAWRIGRLFHAAASEGVVVRQQTLSATELWNLMREQDTLVLLLVDVQRLHVRGAAAEELGRGMHTFSGHYVLVTGLDDARGGFWINDPAREDERTFVHSESLEAARLADGTDQDLILIPVYQPPPVPPPPDSTSRIVRVACVSQSGPMEEGRESIVLR